MNQILITEKLYITPELRRKKLIFRIEFFIAIFLLFVLSCRFIYAEYDRNKHEQVSHDLLAEVKVDDTVKKISEDDVMVIVLDRRTAPIELKFPVQEQTNNEIITYTAEDGRTYNTEAVVNIPSIDIKYPVLTETSEELLEISINKYWGPKPNEVGNYCIVGHNYRNGKMFGRLSELVNGDIIELEDLSGNKLKYKVYNKYVVEPTDTKCTSQLTNGKRELTLITCTNYGKQRLVVKCREV